VVIHGEMEYEVEKILSKRKRYGKVEYLIQWKRYTTRGNTWEKLENLENIKEIVRVSQLAINRSLASGVGSCH